jgi:PIN domain
MKSIAELVADLLGDPRPVLCLDTCVFLDVITTGNRGLSDLITVNRRLAEVIATTPERVQLVVTSLVLREWKQRRDEVRAEATKWLQNLDRQIVEVHRAWERLGHPLNAPVRTYYDINLVNELTILAESLLRSSAVLKEDTDCVMRALQRVKWKKRPSHNKEIKDSIHLENYLELSRQLLAGGLGHPVLFTSTNSSDFWQDKNTPGHPHAELAGDLSAAHLQFFGRLPLALIHLGILAQPAPAAAAPPAAAPPAAGGP